VAVDAAVDEDAALPPLPPMAHPRAAVAVAE